MFRYTLRLSLKEIVERVITVKKGTRGKGQNNGKTNKSHIKNEEIKESLKKDSSKRTILQPF